MTVAAVDTFAAGITGREPRFPLDGVKLSRYKMFFDPAKAVRELGLTATELAKRLGMTQPAVSYAVIRGEQIAKGSNYNLVT